MVAKKNREGEERLNNQGVKMIIKKYKNKKNVDIYFPDYNEEVPNRQYKSFELGTVRCKSHPEVYGKGYEGLGEYSPRKDKKAYMYWNGMLRRCYDENYLKKHPSYIDCEVCEEWLNFQNFAEWFYKNYYQVENEIMCLDKDILKKKNKTYSPYTCVFVPISLNNLVINRQLDRGELPLGVIKSRNKYIWQLSMKNKRIKSNSFDNPIDAFYDYKKARESYIQETAEKYKKLIPNTLYKALCNWEIEITD